ncbi:MAG TPA: hypothetical protein PK926_16950 [Spirochaetota bacterium]|nr:hypothetical protein [Spirochaetota bacterium]HPI90754.1 hypothetical protein [Spirochaetota bacterium]HPR49371.1 hypothetical protein [Spirochaetota bacterium]
MKKILLAAVSALIAGLTSPLFPLPRIGGEVEVYGSAGLNTEDISRASVRADAELRHAFNETEIVVRLRAEEDSVRINNPERSNPYDSKDPDDFFSHARIYLREAYINQDFYFDRGISSISLKAGKIIHTWGSCDEVKPVDILNPQDLSFLFMKPLQERKYAMYSAMLSIFITESIFLEGVVLPQFVAHDPGSRVFVPNMIDEFDALSSTPGLNTSMDNAKYPPKKLSDMSYGARFGFTVFDIDAHLNYFWGYDHWPVYKGYLTVNSLSPLDANYAVKAHYKLLQMFGMDFQRAIKWGLAVRGEFAYFERGKYFDLERDSGSLTSMITSAYGRDLLAGGDGVVEKDQIRYTVGFDVTDLFTDNLYFNFQFNQEIIIDYENDIADDEFSHLLVWTLEYSFLREKARVKFRGFLFINDLDFAGNLEFKYNIGANYEVAAGVWLIEGSRDGTYGQFGRHDLVYVSGKATF